MRNEKVYYEKTATLISTRTDVAVDAEADNIRTGESFDAYVAGNKIKMKWNGKIFVGNALGMEMTSSGPKALPVTRRF
jgi:hypothetical protein